LKRYAEKLAMVRETYAPGMTVSLVARKDAPRQGRQSEAII